ncbi:MAG: 1-acyl-sn-glycerol-3-phosphate acyltransferase [Thermomicrobiales bacterium]|nr:1-acyl-sn-glycerol-3-phosphate acyltransferase [Thermomicrobiales bacterium]MCO5224555.1 1-acyl-sn-glycerol-3-phosphate acyltransferase [Thermomicrobiales bacterium]MCO5229488.1 1-acyl-sn-glycerol-3-phosphate acyltransferase [Thermomicrobiales bacterium]
MSTEIDLKTGTMRPITFSIARRIVYGLCWLLFGLRARGQENFPKEGGFILVGNHLHNLDPVFVLTSSVRPVHFMAKQELFEVPVIKRIVHWAWAFPVNRGKMDRSAIRSGQAVLQSGNGLGIYPEGTRSLAMSIQHVLPGAGLFATGGHYPIVPVAITGSERVPFNGAKGKRKDRVFPRRNHRGVRVEFGAPFYLPEEIDGKRVNAASATDYMMRKVAEMLPEDYRGMYS